MAGKKRGSTRQRKRADAAFESTVEEKLERADDDQIIQRSEAGELFVIDTDGDTNMSDKIIAVQKAGG